MAIMQDKAKEEQKEKEEVKKKEGEKTWFQNVPVVWKLGGIGLIFVKYLMIVNAKGNISELWFWIIAVLVAWYLIGQAGMKRDTGVLTPEEAEAALKKEIARKVKDGQISKWAKIYVGPNNGLYHHEGMPDYYIIGVEIITYNKREYRRGLVFAVGKTKGYATLQNVSSEITGTETVPSVVIIPPWLKRSKKYDLDLDKYVYGDTK